MKIHPREVFVDAAETALRVAIVEHLRGLTTAERLRVMVALVQSEVGGIAKFAIREERHGDTETPGGLEA